MSVESASAQVDNTWSTTPTDNLWTTQANWSRNVVPTLAGLDNVIFGGSTTLNITIPNSAGAFRLNFNNTAATTLSTIANAANLTTKGGGGIIMGATSGAVTITEATGTNETLNANGSDQTYINNSPTSLLSIGHNVGNVNNAGSTLTFDGVGAITLGGGVSDRTTGSTVPTTNLIKNGTGTLTESGNSTMRGTITVNAGMLSTVGTIDNATGILVTGGTYLVGASTGYGGPVTVNGGVLEFASSNSIGSSSSAAKTLTFNGGTISGSGTSTRTIDAKVSWVIGGDVGFGGFGSGTSGGTVQINGSVNLGGVVRTIDVGTTGGGVGNVAIVGAVSNGGIIKTGPNNITSNSLSTYALGTVVNAGALQFQNPSDTIAGGVITAGPFGIGPVTLNAGTALRSNNTTSRLLQNNIIINDTVTLGGTTATNGALTFNSANGANALTTPATFNLGTGTPTLNVIVPVEIANAVTGSSLTKTGTSQLILSADNSYTGDTHINVGTLQVGNGGTTGSIPGKITISTGAALTVNRSDAALNLPGPITNGGSVSNIGTGAVTLSGVNTYTGGTTVTAGTLIAGNADALAGGALDVSDGALAQAQASLPKAVTVSTLATHTTGKFDLTNNSMVIRGSNLAAVQAQIASGFAAGNWTGAGIDSSTAAADATHRTAIGYADNSVLTKSTFKGVTGLVGTDVLVKYTYFGDADLNGVVTLDDFTQFLSGYQNNGTTWLLGDFDYNGKVTLDDFTLFLDAYQNQGAPLAALDDAVASANISSSDRAFMLAAIQAVPEPTSLAVLGIAGAGLLGRRGRRRSA